jgi:hypothetical protein
MIDIIYRCCNAEVEGNFKWIRPNFFDKIKCLNTFLNSVEHCSSVINKVIFLHDGPKGRLYENIPKKFEIIEVDYRDNEKSLLETFKIADSLNKHIYFIEDDYLHLEKSIDTIYNGVLNFKLVTGYDHLDRYTRTDDITMGKDYIAFSKKTNSHWRTCESTCCTWACTRDLWNSTMKEAAYNFKLQDRDLFRYLITKKNIRLWNPIPGVITQVDQNLSPGINWNNII